ncbi:MAG: geranylgeranyl pyrophosphate synthase [Acidimicrobiales bacterium]|nr:MAG: geranylgeranyl pyrophosphate synthase [Acidimicrobiales bacterium]
MSIHAQVSASRIVPVVALTDALSRVPGFREAMTRVESRLLEAVRSEDDFLTEVASHLIHAGGKRLRPAFAVAAAHCHQSEIGAGSESERIWSAAVSVELVHLGSLYHDDVMDDAVTRRRVESVNARWGNLRAILAGDFLLARASELAAGLGDGIAGMLAGTIARLCEGQIRELQDAFNVDRTEQGYFRSIEGKTASLFETSLRVGAMVSRLPPGEVESLGAFGRAFGMAFQVVDDILDVVASEEELGKPAGNDLVEGVYTLPVIRALSRETDGSLRSLLGRPLTTEERDQARILIRESGVISDCLDVARKHVELARAHLSRVVDGPVRKALEDTAAALLHSVPAVV